ncbi:MAG: glutamate-5-semialdehyde dehydrogenase [Lachnospiraceae bacterium]|nr:glutamate-5-semialdehyde dehydrogenase [Candidatus Darwinimomas equi]
MTTQDILAAAAGAKPAMAILTTEQKNRALSAMADSLIEYSKKILEANAEDKAAAEGRISEVMMDRLKLDDTRVKAMADGMRDMLELPDPVGKVLSTVVRPNGMVIEKVSVPVGVLAIIYESRPNVTSDAAALSIKSGNVCVLRSGKEAFRSANAIVDAMREGLKKCGLTETFINLIQDTTRQSASELMTADKYVDMLIPRGGAGLIRACVENATVPCIHTGTGICHVYVDDTADQEMALNIVENAKTSRPSVCNAEEVLLVAESIAGEFLPKLRKRLVEDRKEKGLCPVELRLCEKSQKLTDGIPAGDGDFDTEFLDYILAVKIVRDVKEAADHISRHSTKHSEAIVTSSDESAGYFTQMVDSACIYVNTSTRFTDGGEFGLGCEMGISTQKLHARGPMGLNELTTYKYVIRSNGATR